MNFTWVAPTAFLLGALLCIFGFGVPVGKHLGVPGLVAFAGSVFLWSALYVIWGFRIRGEKTWQTIERFGTFYRIIHDGPRLLCLPGLIDKVREEGVLQYGEIPLYSDADEKDNELDFADASAPVNAKIWGRVGRHDEIKDEKTLVEINEDIYRWTYATEQGQQKKRVEEVMDDVTRPILQGLKLDDANKQKREVAKKIIDDEDGNLKKSLAQIGFYLNPHEGLVISDIAIPPSVKKLREQVLEGEKDAERAARRGEGYAMAIKKVIEIAKKDGGGDITWEQARKIYETQRGLETLKETGANITFISRDVKGVLANIGIGGDNHHGKRPPPKEDE